MNIAYIKFLIDLFIYSKLVWISPKKINKEHSIQGSNITINISIEVVSFLD
jgi:hypothetical protein